MSDRQKSEKADEGGSAVRLEDGPEKATDATDVTGTSDASDTTTSATTVEDDDTRDAADGDTHDTHDSDTHDRNADDATDDVDLDDEDDDLDDDEDDDGRSGGRTGLFVAIGVAAVAVIGVLVLLAAFVWPNFMGPGKPDDTASQAVSALSSKDAARLQQVSCQRQDGKPSTQVPPELLQLIQSATPSGPVVKTLDYEARQPVSITIAAGGQPQSGPVEIVLAVNNGNWCMNNISAAQ